MVSFLMRLPIGLARFSEPPIPLIIFPPFNPVIVGIIIGFTLGWII